MEPNDVSPRTNNAMKLEKNDDTTSEEMKKKYRRKNSRSRLWWQGPTTEWRERARISHGVSACWVSWAAVVFVFAFVFSSRDYFCYRNAMVIYTIHSFLLPRSSTEHVPRHFFAHLLRGLFIFLFVIFFSHCLCHWCRNETAFYFYFAEKKIHAILLLCLISLECEACKQQSKQTNKQMRLKHKSDGKCGFWFLRRWIGGVKIKKN